MDDFLHNLRSGKLKQADRGRREFTDYKGPQRRVGNERRRTDYYAKVTAENFQLVKESLDVLAENQRRIADAMAAGRQNSARIADALEAIATMLGRHWGYEEMLDKRHQPAPTGNETVEDDSAADGSDDSAPTLMDQIAAMRADGDSWEKIARHLDEQKIPTVSGKGKWRGVAVKKFWDANA